jgi:hypothetical protein
MPSLKKHGMLVSILDEHSNGQTTTGGLPIMMELRTRIQMCALFRDNNYGDYQKYADCGGPHQEATSWR